MRFALRLVLLVALLALPAGATASNLRVFTFSQPRASVCQANNWAFVAGNTFTNARNAILSPANFGPTGVVPRSIEFVSDTLITPAALIGVDILLLTVHSDTLKAIEKFTVKEFVRQGGGLFYFANNAAINMAPAFGGTPGPVNVPCGTVSAAIPPVTGPFGSAAGCFAAQYHLSFTSAGPGSTFLSDGLPVGVTYIHQNGRAILLCDEEWIINPSVLPPCGVAGNNGSRITLFLNAVAWVAPSEAFEFDPGQAGVPAAPSVALIASPNPFTNRTTIRLSASGPVQITIFDTAGRAVRRLESGPIEPSTDQSIEWDGQDDSGRRLPSGMYPFRVDSGDITERARTGRLWLVR